MEAGSKQNNGQFEKHFFKLSYRRPYGELTGLNRTSIIQASSFAPSVRLLG